jgi:hypothetical protein
MPVTIWDGDFYEGNQRYFPYGIAFDLSDYTQKDGESWNNDISSLYTTDPLYVFDYKGLEGIGGYRILQPGYWSGPELADFGAFNNDISSFFDDTSP